MLWLIVLKHFNNNTSLFPSLFLLFINFISLTFPNITQTSSQTKWKFSLDFWTDHPLPLKDLWKQAKETSVDEEVSTLRANPAHGREHQLTQGLVVYGEKPDPGSGFSLWGGDFALVRVKAEVFNSRGMGWTRAARGLRKDGFKDLNQV